MQIGEWFISRSTSKEEPPSASASDTDKRLHPWKK